MICATRRQFALGAVNAVPWIWLPGKTSHNRNSTRTWEPSSLAWPVTRACAPVGFQFWKLGVPPSEGPLWINAARSIGRKSPLRARSFVTIAEIFAPSGPPPRSVTATGMGALRALLTSITAEPDDWAHTGPGAASRAAEPSALTIRSRRRNSEVGNRIIGGHLRWARTLTTRLAPN